MNNVKIYWNKKGHTVRACPADTLIESNYWPDEDYGNEEIDTLVYINPILINSERFEADITVSPKRQTAPGSRHIKHPERGWTSVPARLPLYVVYGRIGKDNVYSLHINHYKHDFNTLSSDLVKHCIDAFSFGRLRFTEVFRNENACCT
jgi:hypothetical protein